MGANGKRIAKLEQETRPCYIEPLVLFEEYPGQRLGEAMEKARLPGDARDCTVYLMSIEDAATL